MWLRGGNFAKPRPRKSPPPPHQHPFVMGLPASRTADRVLIYRAPPGTAAAFHFTYAKPCTILKFLSRAALQPDDFENPTISVEVSDVEERRSKAARSAASDCSGNREHQLFRQLVPLSLRLVPRLAHQRKMPRRHRCRVSPRAAACISQGIRIKGEITGKEDLFVDGTVEGKLDFGNASVTVGPNGKVKADISAREVIVRGTVDGKIEGTERVQLWNSGRVTGEVRTERLAIEDGALLRGKVEAGKAQSRTLEAKPKSAPADASESGKSNSAAASSRSAVI